MRSLTLCSLFAAACAVGHVARASIAIVNPGFEDPVTTTTTTTITGWTQTPPGNSGVWNINAFPAGFWTVGAPEGNQVAFLANAPLPGSPSQISQILSATLQANTQYDFSYSVGAPIGFGGTPTPDTLYTVELLAGVTPIITNFGVAPEGVFNPSLNSFNTTTPFFSAFVGQTLSIRLSSTQPQTAFDNFVLNDTPLAVTGTVPEPASLAVWAGIGIVASAGAWMKARKSC